MGIDRSSSGSGEIIRPETGAYATEIGGLSDIPQNVQNDFDLWILRSVPGSDFYRMRVISSVFLWFNSRNSFPDSSVVGDPLSLKTQCILK